jgi:hypothetical protein
MNLIDKIYDIILENSQNATAIQITLSVDTATLEIESKNGILKKILRSNDGTA